MTTRSAAKPGLSHPSRFRRFHELLRAVPGKPPLRKAIGYALGLLLLGAAVAAVATQGNPADTLAPLLRADPLLVIALIAATAATPVAVAIGFWATTNRYGDVTAKEMTALISAAWLLNYLPLWPGMFTRLAYHKAVNNITVKDAVKGILWANAINTVNAALLAVATIGVAAAIGPTQPIMSGVAIAAPAGVMLALAARAKADPPARDPHRHFLYTCAAVRYAELHLWAIRYWLVFALLDTPITWLGAAALAALVTLAKTVPIAPNGVGVRTWAVAGIVPAFAVLNLADPNTATPDWQAAATADLVLLAAELAVALPMGLAAGAWVAAQRRKARIRASTS